MDPRLNQDMFCTVAENRKQLKKYSTLQQLTLVKERGSGCVKRLRVIPLGRCTFWNGCIKPAECQPEVRSSDQYYYSIKVDLRIKGKRICAKTVISL